MSVPTTPKEAGQAPALSIDGSVARITLRRPASHNRLEPADIELLGHHFEQVASTPAIRVVVLQSVGKTFSSGFDLRVLGQDALNNVLRFERLADAIEHCPAVTIARVHAPVYGGATDLVLACDYRLGARGVRMFMPAAKLGLHYYPRGLQRWVSRLGLGPAKKLFLTARTVHDQEMHAIGYLDELAAPDELDHRVELLVRDLLAVAPIPQRTMKARLNDASRGMLDERSGYADLEASLASQDLAEALDAFATKRVPVFVGR